MRDNTKKKGNLAELAVAHDLARRGYQLLFPFGENTAYDIVIDFGGRFVRVQTKFSVSKEDVWVVRPHTMNRYVAHLYTVTDIEYLAAYDGRTETIIYIPAIELGQGMTAMAFRWKLPASGQVKGIRLVDSYRAGPK